MGKKFGSVHIRMKDSRVSINTVSDCYRDIIKGNKIPDVTKIANKLGLTLDKKQLPLLESLIKLGTSEDTYKIVQHSSEFVSIYDERMSFENVQSIAEKLSLTTGCPILFSSVYDDDIYLFGLSTEGVTIARHISGQCDAYGICQTNENIEEFEKYLPQIPNNEQHLSDLQGIAFEKALEKCLGFTLML